MGVVKAFIGVCAALGCLWSPELSAQRPVAQPSGAGRLRPEVRLEFIGARDPIIQLGAGVSFRAGTYARVTLLAASGVAVQQSASVLASRVDLHVRYMLDPFGESRWGAYGLGGLSLMHVRSEHGGGDLTPRLVLGIGVEGRPRAVTRAVEVGLGGGTRVALALRKGLPGRR